MQPLAQAFEERLQELDAYLEFLEALDVQMQIGTPRIGDTSITTQQQRILFSAVYLQLYNLVEATITRCVDSVCAATAESGRWRPSDLSVQLRREWVRVMAHTHLPLNDENRLLAAVALSVSVHGGYPGPVESLSPYQLY